MRISILTDEVSADPETAIELGAEWGVHDFELRGCFTERVPRLTAYQRHHLHDALDEHGARLIAIGPGLFKTPFPPSRAPRVSLGWMERSGFESWAEVRRAVDTDLREVLRASIDFAGEFGVAMIAIFGFDRAGAPVGRPPDEALDYIGRAAALASGAGIRLVLENEAGFWADTGGRTAEMVRAINNPGLGVNWDPGNAFFAGDEPYPTGYRAVRGLVSHVHFKDARRRPDGTIEHAVDGEIDWPGQIRALADDGYQGFVSIETHMLPKIASARAELARLRAMIDAASGPR